MSTGGHMSQIMTWSSSQRQSQNNHLIAEWDGGGSTESDSRPDSRQTRKDRQTRRRHRVGGGQFPSLSLKFQVRMICLIIDVRLISVA